MKYDCEMIADLLPLYKDGACSGISKTVVEEHLKDCPNCTKMFEMMNDSVIDDEMIKEKDEVIGKQAKYFKRKSAVVGAIVGGIFALPVLICLIVDIAAGAGLSWFFIVLAAMLVPTSLFVVPLMSSKNKMFNTMVSFTLSIIFLLGIIALIQGGGGWFFVASAAVLFGLTVLFAPFIANRRPVKNYLGNKKGLAVMGAYTLTYVLMMVVIGIYAGGRNYSPLALGISTPFIVLAWLIFFVIRYVHINGFLKAATVIGVIAVFNYFLNTIIASLILHTQNSAGVVIYTEPTIFSLFMGLALAAVFAVIGLIAFILGGKKNEEA